jgi:hypothetical protein
MVIDSASIFKVASNDSMPEVLFKEVALVEKELATPTVKGRKLKASHAIRHVSDMANYYVPTADDYYKVTKTGNTSLR